MKGGVVSYPFKGTFLRDAQELRLQCKWQLANLIQEHRSAFCHLQFPKLLCDCAGKATSFMTEEFRFEQIGRQRGTIDDYERLLCTRAIVMDGPSHYLLPVPDSPRMSTPRSV